MALTPEQKELAKHRFERAKTTLNEAIDELSRKNFRLAVNRAYYSVFYAMRAFLVLLGSSNWSKNIFDVTLLRKSGIRVPKARVWWTM
ncbi:hypothetical protein HKBW3S42_00474 [Candidatus Hakubella thermalkaliphila]|uniref:HEPN domain-containing protein n=1 Tax=Candidatus Hakubella thermalkaliphila TaxID=2754717 RepID=A0A6V8PHM4_9ACTN|nr:hypothetical protein HKBW3S42_00474 [Candidatus Hakubella thermalkaliphila]